MLPTDASLTSSRSNFLGRLGLLGLGSDLIELFGSIPRDIFVPSNVIDRCWHNESLPLPCGQTLWSPDLTARLFSESHIESSHTVLEFGTGSGYLSALLGRSSRKVRSLERYSRLVDDSRSRLRGLGINNVIIEHSDALTLGSSGLYDRIICDSCFPSSPDILVEHLVVGGFVVCGLRGDDDRVMLVRLTKSGSRLVREDLFVVGFIDLESGCSHIM